jgi:hypothetical protein
MSRFCILTDATPPGSLHLNPSILMGVIARWSEARLTQRETSHPIVTMAARSWIFEEEEKKPEKG